MNYPFHYEVRFRLLAFDSENKVKTESYIKKCNNHSDPLTNRKEAFAEFDEYLSYLKQGNRVIKIKSNFSISQPADVSELVNRTHTDRLQRFEWREKMIGFREEISVYLVLTDPEVLRVLETDENEFEIHKIASYEFEEQDIIDNLDLIEVPLYEHFKIDIYKLKQIVYHYGLDFAESGEDTESGAKRTILPTPQIWSDHESYIISMASRRLEEEKPENQNTEFRIKNIISQGESHQVEFKPSMLFNFKSSREDYFVKFIIARVICSFLNSSGGMLLVGVKDDGKICGLEHDYSLFKVNVVDKFKNAFDGIIASFFNLSIKPLITGFIENVDEKDIFLISVESSSKPVYLKNTIKQGDKFLTKKEFYIRMLVSTHQLEDMEEIGNYIFNNWIIKNDNNEDV